MKTTNVYIRSGVVCAVTEELPKEPIYRHLGSIMDDGYLIAEDASASKDFERTLQRIKDNAVPFEDQPLVAMKIHEAYRKNVPVPDEAVVSVLKDDTFYPLSVEVEIVEVCDDKDCVVESSILHRKVARIKEPVIEQTPINDVIYSLSDIFDFGKFVGPATDNTYYKRQFKEWIRTRKKSEPVSYTQDVSYNEYLDAVGANDNNTYARKIYERLIHNGFTITRKVN